MPSSVGRYKSTRIDEGSKCCILLAIKIRAGTVVGTGEVSQLYYWKGESSTRITSGMGKRKEMKCTTAAGIIRYPSKFHRSTRSGLAAVVLCNWSMYSLKNCLCERKCIRMGWYLNCYYYKGPMFPYRWTRAPKAAAQQKRAVWWGDKL